MPLVMLLAMMPVPLVLPWPDVGLILDAPDVLVIAKSPTVNVDDETFLSVFRLREMVCIELLGCSTVIEETPTASCTASHDTVLCYAIEFASFNGIEVIYDTVAPP